MRADEVLRLRRLCELFEDVAVHPGPVVQERGSKKNKVVLNVQVRVVLDTDPALFEQFESGTKEAAQSEATDMLRNALAEYADLTSRLIAAHEASQQVIAEVTHSG